MVRAVGIEPALLSEPDFERSEGRHDDFRQGFVDAGVHERQLSGSARDR
jgi:hypothetical protein